MAYEVIRAEILGKSTPATSTLIGRTLYLV